MNNLILSPREAEILEKLSLGMSTHEVADVLFISAHTVHTHRKNILRKLGVHSMLLAVRLHLQGQISVESSGQDVKAFALTNAVPQLRVA